MSTTQQPDAMTEPMRIILHGVTWAAYRSIRDVRANDDIRMTYLDGALELMSPDYVQLRDARRLGMIVRAAARPFDLVYTSAGRTTLRRRRRQPLKGQGVEPDSSFYFGAHAEQIAGNRRIDLRVDPPPDLAIVVDYSADSRWKLIVFARLRVPEVWRYDFDSTTLWFGRLGTAGKYEAIEQSAILPMLTRGWVLDVLKRGEGVIESLYEAQLKAWIRTELNPPCPD